MKSAAGDRVVLQAPGGTAYLTVLEVCYERISVEPFDKRDNRYEACRRSPLPCAR